jgi:hypothetical protein
MFPFKKKIPPVKPDFAKILAAQMLPVVRPQAANWRPSSFDQVPRLNQRFFKRVTTELETLGFKMAAEIEVLPPLRARPDSPVPPVRFLRYLFRAPDATGATLYQVDSPPEPQAFDRLASNLTSNWPTRGEVLNLETEFDDGTWIITSTANSLFDTPPEINREQWEPNTTGTKLDAAHTARVAQYRAAHPEAKPVPIAGYGELVAKEERQRAVRTRFRLAEGVRTEELKRFAKNRFEEIREQFYKELGELVAGEGGAGTVTVEKAEPTA